MLNKNFKKLTILFLEKPEINLKILMNSSGKTTTKMLIFTKK